MSKWVLAWAVLPKIGCIFAVTLMSATNHDEGSCMRTLRSRLWAVPALALAAIIFGMAFVVSSGEKPADAAGLAQGQLVPETPRRDVPVVLDGRVLAHAKVGDRIFVGGDFQQVQLIDGSVITQPYIFAYDIDTGVLDPNFRPVLNKVVRSLEPTQAGDGLYVGGLFSLWDDSFPLRVAKLDAEGQLITSFGPRASARVQSIVEVGDSVYIGGDFTQVSGQPAQGLAKVDRITGEVDPNFLPAFTDSINGSQLVRRVKATPDGSSLFVLHYAQSLDGQTRQAVAKFDLGGAVPTLSGWNVPWIQQNLASNCWRALRDMELSPDGSFLVVGGQGADNPPNCDSVVRYETAGAATVNFTWSARMYSSVFSLAVSDVAVYAGGHFCAAPKNPIPLGGVSSTWTGRANGCDVNDPLAAINPSVLDPDNAVFRKQMAALDPTTGQALDWDPGSNNLVAVYDLTLIDRGLLAGHDSDRFNTFGVGRSGLFDFGAGDDVTAPEIVVTEPIPGGVAANATQIAGTASDNLDVTSVTIRLKNITTDQFLQLDGSFAAASVDLPVTVSPIGLGEVAWSYPVANLPVGNYEIRGFAKDAVGNTSPGLASPFTVPGDAACTVSLDGNDQPIISYSGFSANDVDSVVIRRDGGWIANDVAGAGSYTDSVAPGDYSYLVRWRPDGVRTDVPCTPAPITVPEPMVTATCTVGLDAASKPVLTWDIDGVSRISVREAAAGFIAIVDGPNTYTDTAATPGDYNYLVRYRMNGVNTDLPCSPSPITVPPVGGNDPTCTAAVNAAGEVELNWTAIDGEDRYIVRDNDGFVATIDDVNSYVDTNPTSGNRTYIIRYRMGGPNIDFTCAPNPVVVP